MHSNQPTSTESTDPSLMVANVPRVRCCYMQLWVSVSSHDTCRSDTIILHFSEVNWEAEFYMTCPDQVTNKAQSPRILNQMGSRGQDPHLSRMQWPYLLPSRGSQDLQRDKTRPREIIETLIKSLQCLMHGVKWFVQKSFLPISEVSDNHHHSGQGRWERRWLSLKGQTGLAVGKRDLGAHSPERVPICLFFVTEQTYLFPFM